MKGKIGVGLIGFGRIGRGVVKLFLGPGKSSRWFKKFGLELRKIADLDISTDRGVEIPPGILTANGWEIIEDDSIDIVVELIGGLEPARSFILGALERGKSVVTANKAVLAAHGDELFRTAAEKGVGLMFEASVGGGIPIIRSIRQGLSSNRVESIYAILNGTTNYILTKMESEGLSFDEALEKAQREGYAEADPSLDVDGRDAAQKLIILLRIAFGISAREEDIYTEGIRRITMDDLLYAKELGYAVKLLAIAKRRGDRVEARVHPVMIPSGAILTHVRNEYNAIEIVGDATGPQLFYGKGAGEMPTASAVIGDIVDLAERSLYRIPSRVDELLASDESLSLMPMGELEMSYYFRFKVIDKPGVLASIARILADENISIDSVIQKGRAEGQTVPLIIMTHEARESSVMKAVERLDALPVVTDRTMVIRVEKL